MFKNKKLEFEINNGQLIVGDDYIRLSSVKMLCVRPSFMRIGQYSIHVNTKSMILELYFTGTEQEVQKEFLKLCAEIKKENPQFYGIFYEYLVNFDNVKDVIYQNKKINSYAQVSFKSYGDLIFKASQDDFDKLKSDFDDYKDENNITI
ncbi:MAG: hypothetical protein IJW36_02065 [Clostridia bacterium]|nr:hypothetical protein [Clostridia bacterium]